MICLYPYIMVHPCGSSPYSIDEVAVYVSSYCIGGIDGEYLPVIVYI